jgi:ring-1,2-phenylacetyl-CoA epoxidase subunit PaaB
MKDTQWPSYIVFDQPGEGKPAFYAGAVHAPDPDMALLNARDVFARRDDHVTLWVVRQSHIYAKTAEELNQPPNQPTNEPLDYPASRLQDYLVFQKTVHKGTLVHVGDLQATGAAEAMTKALETFPNPKAIVWWVLPALAIHRTDPAENDALFGPAESKPFRHSNFYPTVTLMREISLANEKLHWEDD